MKKITSVLLAVCLVVMAVSVFSACKKNADNSSTTVYGFNYSVTADETAGEGYKGFATVKKYVLTEEQSKIVSKGHFAGNMIDLVIPAEYTADNGDKYKVNAISDAAFANQVLVKSVTIGANIETVGAGCLAGCANLRSLTVAFVGAAKDAVNEKKTLGYLFGTSSASGTSAATVYYNGGSSSSSATYYIPTALKTVTVTGDEISDYAFNGLPVENIVLSGNVTVIPEGAFANMTAIANVKLPASVKVIGKAAFKSASSVITVNFAELTALEEIGAEAFSGCSNFGYHTTLTFASSVKTLGTKAFYNCTSLQGVDFSASAVTAISDYCFYGCKELATAAFPAGATEGKYAFEGCEKLDK